MNAQASERCLDLEAFQAAGGRVEPVGSLSTRQQEILVEVMNVEGYIDQELHSEFWSLMPCELLDDPNFEDLMTELLNETVLPSQIYMRETYLSARASIAAGQVTYSPGFDAAVERIENATDNEGFNEGLSRRYQATIDFLEAAANGTPIQRFDGPFYVTDELVDQVLSGLDASSFRTSRLFAVEWDESVSEYRYPALHVAVLSPQPFAGGSGELRTLDGRTVRYETLGLTPSRATHLQIAYVDLGGAFSDPDGALVNVARSSLAAMGISSREPMIETWRGRTSAFSSGMFDVSGERGFVHVRVIEYRENDGALMLMALSQNSMGEAGLLLDDLERSIQLRD